jgi:hypothetical protein
MRLASNEKAIPIIGEVPEIIIPFSRENDILNRVIEVYETNVINKLHKFITRLVEYLNVTKPSNTLNTTMDSR